MLAFVAEGSEPIERRYSRRISALDLPFGPFGGGRCSTGAVALDEPRDGGGGAREGRKDETTGIGGRAEARVYRN